MNGFSRVSDTGLSYETDRIESVAIFSRPREKSRGIDDEASRGERGFNPRAACEHGDVEAVARDEMLAELDPAWRACEADNGRDCGTRPERRNR